MRFFIKIIFWGKENPLLWFPNYWGQILEIPQVYSAKTS